MIILLVSYPGIITPYTRRFVFVDNQKRTNFNAYAATQQSNREQTHIYSCFGYY